MKTFVYLLAVLFLLTGCCTSAPAPRADLPVVYRNEAYGLTFSLAADWKGYTVLNEEWNAHNYAPEIDGREISEHGPLITLRHPDWKRDARTQDIPILVFTHRQWESDHRGANDLGIFQGGRLNEISQNDKYVFAIHSRFNADDSVKGWAQASAIVQKNMAASAALKK